MLIVNFIKYHKIKDLTVEVLLFDHFTVRLVLISISISKCVKHNDE